MAHPGLSALASKSFVSDQIADIGHSKSGQPEVNERILREAIKISTVTKSCHSVSFPVLYPCAVFKCSFAIVSAIRPGDLRSRAALLKIDISVLGIRSTMISSPGRG